MENNVLIYDNGAAFMIMVNGLITSEYNTLGAAWRHIEWMYKVAGQMFTVGELQVPVDVWLKRMYRDGYLD